MLRFVFACIFLFAAISVSYAQLPNQNGQVWREYVVSMSFVPPDSADGSKASSVPYIKRGQDIIRQIKQETGESAWTDDNFGLISCDNKILYVYHTPQMHERIAQIVRAYMRPETCGIQFAVEMRFIEFNSDAVDKNDVPDFRVAMYPFIQPIETIDGKPVCKTPGVSAYWVAKKDFSKYEEAKSKFFSKVYAFHSIGVFEFPTLTNLNGANAALTDVNKTPFATDVVTYVGSAGASYRPLISVYEEGIKAQSSSLLSFDLKTVRTNIAAELMRIDEVKTINGVGEKMDDGKISRGYSLQTPFLHKVNFSEEGINWRTDGKLVLFLTGKKQYQVKQVQQSYLLWRSQPKSIINPTITNAIITVSIIDQTVPPPIAIQIDNAHK
ncbi:MAG: hypothetical protein LBQ66_07325 [Planctomycetaceae bacterium]|jgi:hypothetical protein|nr:hypothetical protein [Planctomycetaceae bacterium]